MLRSMPKLPVLRPKKLLAILLKQGFVVRRQRGSHAVLKHPDTRMTVIPMHNRDLDPGTLRAILQDTHLDIADLS